MDKLNKSLGLALSLEKKLYNAIKPLLIVSQFFCVAPIGDNRLQPLKWISPKVILHISWCTLVCVYILTSIYFEYLQKKIPLRTVQKPLFFSEYFVFVCHITFLVPACYFKHKLCAQYIRTTVSIDCSLAAFGKIPKFGILKRFTFIHLTLWMVYIVSVMAIIAFWDEMTIIESFDNLIVYLIPNFIIGISMIQYYILLFIIYLRWKFLYKAIQEFKQKYETDNRLAKLRISQEILDLLRGIYCNLEIFTKEVNSTFSISILIIYFGSFINLSLNIFFVYKCIDDENVMAITFFLYSFIWAVMHMGKMFCVLYFNHLILVEKDKIAVVVKNLNPLNLEMEITVRIIIYV
ncbi:putative gustatory receptor 59f [Episyrphus balteatus]|uniref:putative gustatory receptor 59f n=1 Tax=Episyrphus balteatus TaxID=286459 RepID=UPI0024865A94|nr:putative gustatory receptor 59f [Episyrphus balteatus]